MRNSLPVTLLLCGAAAGASLVLVANRRYAPGRAFADGSFCLFSSSSYRKSAVNIHRVYWHDLMPYLLVTDLAKLHNGRA
jgi:hypothetical protein